MTFRINANSVKNAMGTVFLLAAAFFVCSTFISMRSVFADPVINTDVNTQKSGRQSPRAKANSTNRATVSRSTTARTPGATTRPATRATASQTILSRGIASSRSSGTTTRGVTSRSNTSNRTTTNNRSVRARTATNQARVSATGNVMAAGRASSSTTYSYLSSKLYTGSYSNIIDSTTGLISADAYSNCLESYYTCMDEICTARSDTKGRCSCAGRATNFLQAETQLEQANEELIKLSGQLSLLISTKGKGDEIASAFTLTEAEQVMNCVSWKEAENKEQWYKDHPTYTSKESNQLVTTYTNAPWYCTNNSYGFNIGTIDGSGSDILAQLKAWADAKDLAKQYETNDGSLVEAKVKYLKGIVNNLASITTETDPTSIDTLANKWGYKLFEYAHNNVCGRVLDSCFNGIYEACGTPVSVTDSDGKTHNRCGNGATSNCPFNFNSYISVVTTGDNSGDVKLNERGSSNSTSSISASCFGYTTTSTTSTGTRTVSAASSDPYYTLRGPVADARRSIMQKYLLDANAACDTYGAALKTTAQNINYQKIAAEQALQAKRLEFKQEADAQTLADATTAIDNFNECISEIWDCYEEYEDEDKWTTARIKAYCSQVSQVPHCYETMICSPLPTQLTAVIDLQDSKSCNNSNDYKENTCRNVVTISEILYGTGSSAVETSNISAEIREACLAKSLGCASSDSEGYCLRKWKKGTDHSAETVQGTCDSITLTNKNAESGHLVSGQCIVDTCKNGYSLDSSNNTCVSTLKACTSAELPSHATAGQRTWNGTAYGSCVATACDNGYVLSNGACVVE